MTDYTDEQKATMARERAAKTLPPPPPPPDAPVEGLKPPPGWQITKTFFGATFTLSTSKRDKPELPSYVTRIRWYSASGEMAQSGPAHVTKKGLDPARPLPAGMYMFIIERIHELMDWIRSSVVRSVPAAADEPQVEISTEPPKAPVVVNPTVPGPA